MGRGPPRPGYRAVMVKPVHAIWVMLSSPSDMAEEVSEICDSLSAWNSSFSDRRSVALVTRDWRRDAVPNLGESGQAVINEQLLGAADVLFAVFGSRLGMATDEYVSGTAEEIRKTHDAGKPVHVYFCTRPIPMDHDPAQLAALIKFKHELAGLYGEFRDIVELRPLIWRDVENDLGTLVEAPPVFAPPRRPVEFSAQPQSERLSKGIDKNGKIKYETRRWVDLTNRGTEDALEGGPSRRRDPTSGLSQTVRRRSMLDRQGNPVLAVDGVK